MQKHIETLQSQQKKAQESFVALTKETKSKIETLIYNLQNPLANRDSSSLLAKRLMI